jgi:glycosyltransferase involved in cell wall biosynthesis
MSVEIAILLSTFNGARFLSEQLESIVAQSYAGWRLYIRDDGSTDDTVQRLQAFVATEPRAVWLGSGPRLGPAASFMHLLQLAQHAGADHFCFCDQDDVWYPEKLAALSAQLAEHERRAAVGTPLVIHSDFHLCDEHGATLQGSYFERNAVQTPSRVCDIMFRNNLLGCAMLFNRSAAQCVLVGTAVIAMHDWWLALAVLAGGGEVFVTPLRTFKYRQHGANVIGVVKPVRASPKLLRARFKRKLHYLPLILSQLDRALQVNHLRRAAPLAALERYQAVVDAPPRSGKRLRALGNLRGEFASWPRGLLYGAALWSRASASSARSETRSE